MIANIINRVMLADSYKYSHYNQYPRNTIRIFDYFESRGGEYNDIVFFGLQYILKRYFCTPITQEEVEEAYEYSKEHGIPFNKEGWDRIVSVYGGFLPIKIKAVPEGMIIPVKNALFTVESASRNKKDFWVASWIETVLMKVWYPTTIASKSYAVKKMLVKYSNLTGSGFVDYQYHNFGDRGSTVVEAASVGSGGHLIFFKGTDNFHSLKFIGDYYNQKKGVALSIRASEHSTVSSWGKAKRFKFYNQYLEDSKKEHIVACVMDTYDIFKDVDYVTKGAFKDKVESDEYPIFVVRPDSGNPLEVLGKLFKIFEKNNVSYFINDKGYKMFNKYRIIWGDGVNMESMEEMLKFVISLGYSSDNMAFGSGGDLMQKIDRDTSKFAIKCSAIELSNGIIREVFKDPITDRGKASKKGIISLYLIDGEYKTLKIDESLKDKEVLKEIFNTGVLIEDYTYNQIREIANKEFNIN